MSDAWKCAAISLTFIPADSLKISEPQNPEIGELYDAQERRAPHFEAPKL